MNQEEETNFTGYLDALGCHLLVLTYLKCEACLLVCIFQINHNSPLSSLSPQEKKSTRKLILKKKVRDHSP